LLLSVQTKLHYQDNAYIDEKILRLFLLVIERKKWSGGVKTVVWC